MRLAKYLAHAGVASRRAAEEIIRDGRVTVDGDRRSPTPPATSTGRRARHCRRRAGRASAEQRVVYAVNKPAGVVSTARDTQGRQTVVELAGDRGVRLYPVGRLDVDTTGLILLTNDGELANRLTHPRFEVPRHATAWSLERPGRRRGAPTLRGGVELDDGRTAPAEARRLGPNVIELVMHEGRKRQVRGCARRSGTPCASFSASRSGR